MYHPNYFTYLTIKERMFSYCIKLSIVKIVVRWPALPLRSPALAGGSVPFSCPDERSGTRGPAPTSEAELGGYFLGTCPAALRETKKRTKQLAEGTNINPQ